MYPAAEKTKIKHKLLKGVLKDRTYHITNNITKGLQIYSVYVNKLNKAIINAIMAYYH